MQRFKNSIQSNVVERLFNRYTKKGISQLIIALILGYAGFSEDFINQMVSYNWTSIEEFILTYRLYIGIISLTLLLFAGFNILRKEYEKIEIRNLEKILKKIEVELAIKKIQKEMKDYE
jgi:hypothetical protein